MEKKEKRFPIMARSIDSAVLVVGGHLKTILNSLKMMNRKVEILTTPSCENCKVVEKMLDDLDVSYKVIDVTQNPDYLEKYRIFTAPGVVIDEKLEFTGIPNKKELMEKLDDDGKINL